MNKPEEIDLRDRIAERTGLPMEAGSSISGPADDDHDPTDAASEIEELVTRRLDDTGFSRVAVVATYVKTRVEGATAYETVVALVGVGTDDETEIIGFDIGDSEARDFWARVFLLLYLRGLREVTEVLTAEEHGGLREAVAAVYPSANVTLLDEEAPSRSDR
jgi:transposase-like protein